MFNAVKTAKFALMQLNALHVHLEQKILPCSAAAWNTAQTVMLMQEYALLVITATGPLVQHAKLVDRTASNV